LGLHGDRIILGEVRGDEARTLLDSFNTGHAGSMATIHASSAVKALRRFGELAMRSHQQANRDDIAAEIAESGASYITFTAAYIIPSSINTEARSFGGMT